MKHFQLFSCEGQVLESRVMHKNDFCFMGFLDDFFSRTGLDISMIDLEKTIKTINQENDMNIKTVLSVEDDEILSEVLNDYGKRSGHYFLSVPNAEEAEKIIRQYPYLFNVILLDKRLPGLDGDEFGKKVKSFNPHNKIHVVTGDPESIDKELLHKGIESVVVKPINYQIFLNLVGDYHKASYKKVA